MDAQPMPVGILGPGDRLTKVLDTHHIDEARAIVAESYCPHAIRVRGAFDAFRVVQATAARGGLAVDRLSYGADSDVIPESTLGDSICVMHADAGHLTLQARGRELEVGPGDSVAFDADTLFRMRWHEGLVVRNVRISEGAIRRRLGDLRGEPVSDPALNADRPPGVDLQQRWVAAVNLLEHSLSDPTVMAAGDLWWARLEEFMVAALYAAHGSASSSRAADGLRPPTLARALEAINDRAHEPLTLGELAAVAGVSPRTLQLSFASHLGTTPMRYLTRVRLERARAELRTSEPGQTTVATVASRWGFPNHGRFARQYAEAFGNHPSVDLRS